MGTNTKDKRFRFLLPQLQQKVLGTEGEVASFIPYRLEEGITPELIRKELAAQPHMKALAQTLDPERKIYLLSSPDQEVLTLAAEYIGTFHHFHICFDEDCDPTEDDSEEDQGELFDFVHNLPTLTDTDLVQAYHPSEGFGFGAFGYTPQHRSNHTPWWMRSECTPLHIACDGTPHPRLAGALQNMSSHRPLIVTCHTRSYTSDFDDCFGSFHPSFGVEDLSFELESETLVLDSPETTGSYKRQILHQLAREKGASFVRGNTVAQVLELIHDHRGDVNNATLSKAVANALLRRKHKGNLTAKDFHYLGSIFTSRKAMAAAETEDRPLIGQDKVRRQLDQIVECMSFQQRRRELGLPAEPPQYTFAFLGAPGTGKTTWAMRLARELNNRNLLSNTDSICVNAAELKAQFVGHTTAKIKSLFDQYGVIILDEAYSLTEDRNSDSFTREALAQLCVELEKHSGDRLVIFAGYGGDCDSKDDRMLQFLQSNPGINSRIAFKVNFENFQPEQLCQVFHGMLTHQDYRVPDQTDPEVADFFRTLQKDRAFGNCREARNLADRVKIHVAARLAGSGELTRDTACQVLPQDIQGAIAQILAEHKNMHRNAERSIGFA